MNKASCWEVLHTDVAGGELTQVMPTPLLSSLCAYPLAAFPPALFCAAALVQLLMLTNSLAYEPIVSIFLTHKGMLREGAAPT
jgi:hypothetical protein